MGTGRQAARGTLKTGLTHNPDADPTRPPPAARYRELFGNRLQFPMIPRERNGRMVSKRTKELEIDEPGFGRTSTGPKGVLLWLLVAGVAGAGCASMPLNLGANRWAADYDSAEARVQETGRPLLIYFTNASTPRKDSTRRLLNRPAVRERTHDFVRCILFRSYEPDRRYVAQYGVARAPALIVVHRDGTYHAQSGPMSEKQVLDFLARTQPPGADPVLDPHLPRRPDYRWHETIEAAEVESKRSGQPILLVFDRRFSGDWRKLRGLLQSREVYTRAADWVHCRVTSWNAFGGTYISRYGTLKLPAIVAADPQGGYSVLEMPTSSEAIARFLDRAGKDAGVAVEARAAQKIGS